MLESYIDYVIAIKQFQVNDIISKLETVNLNEDLKFNLERSKEILLKDKYIEKIQEIFSSSPIANPDKFYAGKILSNSTDYKQVDETSAFIIIIVGGLFGAIIGIFYALLANAIQNRK